MASASSTTSNPFSSGSSTESRDSQYADSYANSTNAATGPRPAALDSTSSTGHSVGDDSMASSSISHRPREPPTPNFPEDARLMPSSPTFDSNGNSTYRSSTLRSSPLNPSASPTSNTAPSFARPTLSSIGSSSRPASRSSSTHPFIAGAAARPARHTIADDPFSPTTLATLGLGSSMSSGFGEGARGSMILYRLADDPATQRDSLLLPPKFGTGAGARDSVASSSRDSMISFSNDSKYPSGFVPAPRGLVPYAYEPEVDDGGPPDEEDMLHDPDEKVRFRGDKGHFPWRGVVNVTVIVILIGALLCLFVLYPVLEHYRRQWRSDLINGNTRINATGQSPVLFQMPQLVDPDTPLSVRSRTGYDGQAYELVFSDEFNVEGRSFYPGDDPYWEAMDLWYGATGDIEWYDPSQVTTRDGKLVITMDSTATRQAGLTPGSTAPFERHQNHDLDYRSGMVQTWNKFCFTSGYIEVSVTFPGPDENAAGYWPGAWTMGNLARPGYPATTDGMWPYTYDTCDVGTFPNQTNPDGQTPAAAIFSDASRDRYNNELSWLSGQRTSACSCPGSDHPGPRYDIGRGSPELDIFEASINKQTNLGGTVSQSAQFAPFSHDYTYRNDTTDLWENFSPERTRANSFRGSAVQQSVSGVSQVPSDMFQGLGNPRSVSFGFEYYGHPDHREDGYVMWQVDGRPTHRMSAGAVGPDMGPEGAMIGQRLIPEEPMAIILNLGMSPNWQTIREETLSFPAEMTVDYVRVYQRRDEINIGCDPERYPTKKYIEDHLEAYSDVNMTEWRWEKPRNRLWEGSC